MYKPKNMESGCNSMKNNTSLENGDNSMKNNRKNVLN